MKRRGEYELDLEMTSDLAVAAYLLHEGDLFSLFTRRLILDFNKQLSMLKYKNFATSVPAFTIRKLNINLKTFSHGHHSSTDFL